jgi:hypothetical protein
MGEDELEALEPSEVRLKRQRTTGKREVLGHQSRRDS